MNEVVVKSLVAVDGPIEKQTNSFELFGYDIMFDSALRPWLIEVNSGPSMARETVLDEKIKTQLIQDTLQLVAPARFHRGALIEVLKRRVDEMEKAARRPYHSVAAYNNRAAAQDALNKDLTLILRGQTPAASKQGGYTKLCPDTDVYDRIMQLFESGN